MAGRVTAGRNRRATTGRARDLNVRTLVAIVKVYTTEMNEVKDRAIRS